MIPCVKIVTEKVPQPFAAYNFWFFLLIRPESQHDGALVWHEKTHIAQMWMWWAAWSILATLVIGIVMLPPVWYLAVLPGAGIHALLYQFSRDYRRWAEVEAYRVQCALGLQELQAARWLSDESRYGLWVSAETALRLLRGKL